MNRKEDVRADRPLASLEARLVEQVNACDVVCLYTGLRSVLWGDLTP